MRWKVYTFKAPAELMERVRETCSRFVLTRRDGGLTESEFIRRAIEHELDHLRRSVKPRRRRVGNTRARQMGLCDGGVSWLSA